MTDSALKCPNCGLPVAATPVRCDRCGFQSTLSREFLWIYLGGSGLLLLGLCTGVAGVFLERAAPEHPLHALAGWFPLGPWPRSANWQAFVVSGIGLSLAGLGLTRRKRSACLAVAVLVLWQIAWTVRCLSASDSAIGPLLPAIALAAEVLILAVTMRMGLALQRTPRRYAARLQELAAEALRQHRRPV